MVLILIIVFGILSIVFLFGKGSFLIAGYNTSSAKQKAQYDEKKLCRVMGIGTLIITMSLLGSILYNEKAAVIMVGGIFVATVFMLVGTNTLCKKKDSQVVDGEIKKVWYKNKTVWNTIIGTVVVGIVAITMFIGNVTVNLYDDHLSASAFMTGGTDIKYDSIEKIEYLKDVDLGSRTFGIGSGRLQAGNFKNDIYGAYKLYSYTNCKEYIVIDTKEGYVVINDQNENKTLQLYQDLLSTIKKEI